jgi:hypothetical protein
MFIEVAQAGNDAQQSCDLIPVHLLPGIDEFFHGGKIRM